MSVAFYVLQSLLNDYRTYCDLTTGVPVWTNRAVDSPNRVIYRPSHLGVCPARTQ